MGSYTGNLHQRERRSYTIHGEISLGDNHRRISCHPSFSQYLPQLGTFLLELTGLIADSTHIPR